MGKKIGIIGAGGSGTSTLIAAMLTIESDILSTYRLMSTAYPMQGIKLPTLEEFRAELKQRVEQSSDNYAICLDRYRMGCLLLEQPNYMQDPLVQEKLKEVREVVEGKSE